MKEVTAAIIEENNRILIAQRGYGDKLEGMWEFPGGKIEPGETPQECLKREIFEEFEADIEVKNKFGESIYTYGNRTIRLTAYCCRPISGKFVLNVHKGIRWVKRSELCLYEFAPADIPFVEKLKKDSRHIKK